MWEKIVPGVIVSVVTTGILYAAGASMGAFNKTLNDTQIHDVAKEFVDSSSTRAVLLSKMEETGKFKGEKGDAGPQGDQGETGAPGPKWEPSATFYKLTATKTAPKSQEADLGPHSFCALAKSGAPHEKQACVCEVESGKRSTWVLSLTVDESVNGGCYCGAVCLD